MSKEVNIYLFFKTPSTPFKISQLSLTGGLLAIQPVQQY